jgi:hypothetical protein
VINVPSTKVPLCHQLVPQVIDLGFYLQNPCDSNGNVVFLGGDGGGGAMNFNVPHITRTPVLPSFPLLPFTFQQQDK